jgi:hypothetical protein
MKWCLGILLVLALLSTAYSYRLSSLRRYETKLGHNNGAKRAMADQLFKKNSLTKNFFLSKELSMKPMADQLIKRVYASSNKGNTFNRVFAAADQYKQQMTRK